MGFSFNRASQGGGKIRRASGKGDMFEGIIASGYTPTSPLYMYNNEVNIRSPFRTPFTGVIQTAIQADNATYTYSISAGSGTWIDLVALYVNGENVTLDTLSINGNNPLPITPLKIGHTEEFGNWATFMDLYGYSLSMTAYIYISGTNNYFDLYMHPVHPMIMISSQGAIQYPTALTGYSVLRDA